MELDSGIAALLGALIGGGITLVGTWIQSKQQTRRDLIKIATEVALKEFEEILKFKTGKVQPLETFIAYNLNLFSFVKDGKIDLKDLKKLRVMRDEMYKFYNSPEANTK
jgi:hypothetical protein